MTERILPFLIHFVTQVIGSLGYAGIAALMGIESACIPLPSEIIMPFAGYLVYTGPLQPVLGRHGGRHRLQSWAP